MSELLHIPKRAVYTFLQRLNNQLKHNNINILITNNTSLSEKQRLVLWQELSEQTNNFFANATSRQLLLDIIITIPCTKWTISKFENLFTISRNTALRDINAMKQRDNFKPIFDKKKGYIFSESDFERLTHLYDGIIQLQSSRSLIKMMLATFNLDFDISKFEGMVSNLQSLYLKELDKSISYPDALSLVYFTILIDTYLSAHHDFTNIFKQSDIALFGQRQELKIAQHFCDMLYVNFNLHTPSGIHYFLTLLLLSVVKDSDAHYASQSFDSLLKLSTQIATSFVHNQHLGTATESAFKSFIEDIQIQLKVFWYSTRFNTFSNYTGLYHNVAFEAKVRHILENQVDQELYHALFPYELYDEPVTILAMILYTFNLKYNHQHTVNILILSSLPKYTNQLVSAAINQYSQYINITTRSISQPYDIDFDNFNLIITNVLDLKFPSKKTFLIDDYFTDADFDRLRKAIANI